MSSYTYLPLSPGCIRLLRLSPHEDETAPIRCQLFEYSLSSARRGTHLYEALSYCWGFPAKSKTAFTDDGILHVTENLNAALLRLRDPALERIIWIDAVCVNQDDLDEKGRQVQLMAEIYAKASCVVVWLENITGDGLVDSQTQADSHRAFQALHAAANAAVSGHQYSDETFNDGPYDDISDDTDEDADDDANDQDARLAVEKLLRRPWFRRVWVLQEVAAARHILIMCRSADIDGQAFCQALNQFQLFPKDRAMRTQVRSTTYLIKAANLRRKCVVSAPERFSLEILPLRDLVEMYLNREATDRRDKIYALLGMSIDTPARLVPDYQISWGKLFRQFLVSQLPDDASVSTFDDQETAFIKSKAYILGYVFHESFGTQRAPNSQKIRMYDTGPDDLYMEWTIPTTAMHFKDGDLLCLLQGASFPMIVRSHSDHFSIVVFGVDPKEHSSEVSYLASRRPQFTCLLVWDWQEFGEKETSGRPPDYSSDWVLNCVKKQVPDDWNIARMYLQTDRHAQAMVIVHNMMLADKDACQSEYPDEIAIAEFLEEARIAFETEAFEIMVKVLGRKIEDADEMEDLAVQLASTSSDRVQPMMFLLDTQGDNSFITEKVLKAAVGMKRGMDRNAFVKLILDHGKDQISITEDVLATAARHDDRYGTTMSILLEVGRGRITITEHILAEAMEKHEPGDPLLELLLQIKGAHLAITENILMIAAEKGRYKEMIELVRRTGEHVTITENVLKAMRGQEGGARGIDKFGTCFISDMMITECVTDDYKRHL